jgi:Ner family transcriptional regulator
MSKAAKSWHPEDIKAAVRKQGTNLSELSLANDLPEHACRHALQYPYFAAELVIAEFLGVSPRQIWPDRYTPTGETKHPPRSRHPQHTAAPSPTHCQKTEAA